jgi:hypothetical protein
MGRGAQLTKRLNRIASALRSRDRRTELSLIVAAPLGSEGAEGRGVGLHRRGASGSTSGLLVFDPARGPPEVPDGALAPWGLVIVYGPAYVEPPPALPCDASA